MGPAVPNMRTRRLTSLVPPQTYRRSLMRLVLWPCTVGHRRTKAWLVSNIRLCHDSDREDVLAIINTAALAYRGVIPADRWHEPYMTAAEFDSEIAAGVVFWGYEFDDKLVGVMGLQSVRDVDLIRHAYVLPGSQRRGVGGALLSHVRGRSTQRMLVGTWAAAEWAIRFYQQHGFTVVSAARKVELLKAYWTIPDRQIETSVVLADRWDKER
jgi:GNAT superfamily N-acetyltransferase